MHKLHSREKIKEASKIMFWKQGINKTFIKEICESAKISRMTFYREFESKEELVFEVFGEIYEEITKKQNDILEKPIPFMERINEVIYFNYEIVKDISQELLKDIIRQKNPKLKAFIDEQRRINMAAILQQINIEQMKGNIRKDLNLKFIAIFMTKSGEYLFDPEFVELFPNPHDFLNEINKLFYLGIVNRR